MTILNSPIIAMFCLLAFALIAHASLGREASYTHSVFDVLPPEHPQADALMNLWHISDEEVSQPIKIFGKE